MQGEQPPKESLVPPQAFKKVLHSLMIEVFSMQTIHCLLKTKEAGRFGEGQSNGEDKFLLFYS